jgi:hypothetical protein
VVVAIGDDPAFAYFVLVSGPLYYSRRYVTVNSANVRKKSRP